MRRAIIAFLLTFTISILAVQLISAQQVYSWQDAVDESYWYSIFNTEALINSGLGIELTDQDDLIDRFIGEAGFSRDNEPSISPLFLPYSLGVPEYVQSSSTKWRGNPRDEVIRTLPIASMVIAYAAQAKQLERLYQTGIDQNSQTRLAVTLRGYLASEAANYAYRNMRDPVNDLYYPSASEQDAAFSPLDQIAMLWALAELTTLTDGYAFYRGTVSRFESELWASDLFDAIENYSDANPQWLNASLDLKAQFVQALSSYASTVSSASILEKAVGMIHNSARELADKIMDTERDVAAPSIAAAIRALVTAQWMTGDESFRGDALKLWDLLNSRWNQQLCLFDLSTSGSNARYEYSVSEIGDFVGAFSALIYGAGMDELKGQYAAFFEKTVKVSRLMKSETDMAGGSLDGDVVPEPQNAGGPFGTAPVFASKVLFDPNESDPNRGEWYVTNSEFDTARAMYLATQLIWIGQRDRQSYVGPPRYGLPFSREAQFIGLQKQIEELRDSQADNSEVAGIRILLQNTENSFQELRDEINSVRSTAGKIEGIETDLGNLGEQISAIEFQLSAVQNAVRNLSASQDSNQQTSSGSASTTESAITIDESVSILLIVLVILIGFVSYQWVARRPVKD